MKRKPSKYIPHSKKIKSNSSSILKEKCVQEHGGVLHLDMMMASPLISFAYFAPFIEK